MLKIEYKKTTNLIPYVNNSRTHSDEQVQQIAASIKEFGFTNPILLDEDDGVIAGHGRIKAAHILNMPEVPTITLSNLSEAQKKAYVIADNQLALNAGWDLDKLKIEVEGLEELDFNLDLLGFDDDFLNELRIEEPGEGLSDEDAVPEVTDKPLTQLGDIWQLGNHRLMCGDATDYEHIYKLMGKEKANICFTSPPYNAGSLNIKGNERTKNKYNNFDDDLSEKDYFNFLTENLDILITVSDEIFYNIGLVQNNKKQIFKLINNFERFFKDMIYWKKNNVAPHIQRGVINNLIEFIICFGNDNSNRKFKNPQFSQGSYYNVIEGSGAGANEYSKIHKATFPLYLPENIILNFTTNESIVLDCFGGTGTTLIACEKSNRQCRMMELDPKYCDVIVKRWQDYTGKDATLAGCSIEPNENSCIDAEIGETFNSLLESYLDDVQ